MNSENVDTEPSADAQATLCPFLRGVGWARVHFFWKGGWGVGGWGGGGGGGGVGYSAQGTTQFVDHKLTRIIQKELQSLIKYFVRS